MNIRLLAASYAAALAFGVVSLQGAIVQDTPAFSELNGTGLGSVSTVLTMKSPGNTSMSSGCSFWDGATDSTGSAGCPLGGFGGDELALNATYSVSDLGLLDFATLRILYNSSEPGANAVQLDDLRLLIQDSGGALLYSEALDSPVFFSDTASGTGTSAFRFRLDDASAANAFLDPDNILGLAAKSSQETGGNETFFFAVLDSDDGLLPIPEPSTVTTLLVGLVLGLAIPAVRRRRNSN